jgi:hypothetical protein
MGCLVEVRILLPSLLVLLKVRRNRNHHVLMARKEVGLNLKTKNNKYMEENIKNVDNKYTFTIEEKNPVHIRLRLHVNHALAGTITLRREEYQDFQNSLKPEKIYE